MGIRDLEISRLISYLKGLGVVVKFSSKKNAPADAEITLDNSEIVIYLKYNKSKTQIILSLIHEAGHAVSSIHERGRKIDPKMDHVLGKEEHKLSKKERKVIYDDELMGASYWDVVIKDVNVKLPRWKIEAQKELDVWVYKYYYQTGQFPATVLKRQKSKEFNNKWRNR